jgi:hypothetical protein
MAKMMTGHRFTLVTLTFFGLLFAGPAMAQDAEMGAFDGLVPVEGAKADLVSIHPDADFSVYKRIYIGDPWVAFVNNWQRTQNSTRRGSSRVSNSDMERIKTDVAALFKEVFTERLQADGGFALADEAAEDVLFIRPAIIDLDVTAPDTMSPGRSRTYTTSAGAATLYIELYDSVSGAILGRAADRRTTRNSSHRMTWNSRVTNQQEARRMFGIWADRLRAFLDDHYVASAEPEE